MGVMLYRARAVVLTDIDGSMIGYDGSRAGVREAVELLNALHIPVIPVTAKTLHEVSYLAVELGFAREGLIAVVEMGGALCATKGLLQLDDAVEVNGYKCSLLGGFIEDFDHLVEEALRECRALRLSKASLEEAEEILNLRGLEALLATRRMFLEVVWSNDRKCLEEASRKLSKLGLKTFLGKRFLHIGLHSGKREAVLRLLKALENTTLTKPTIVGIGDSDADIEFLELVDKPIIIPQDHMSPDIRLKRADYTIAPHPAPHGWVWAVKHITLNL